MALSRRRTKKVRELLPLEANAYVIALIRNTNSTLSDTALTLGFSRYDRAELRMRVDPFTPDAVMGVLTEIARVHIGKPIEIGIFTDAQLRHPTGERWRFLVRKCSNPGLHAIGAAYASLCAQYGGDGKARITMDDYYQHGIFDIVLSDADNLLPGEAGYNTKIDGAIETVSIH